jgi:hypothetical protein
LAVPTVRAVVRVIFTLVANRALEPCSKVAALEWAAEDVALPGATDLGADPQVFYRAMDFLAEAGQGRARRSGRRAWPCSPRS